MEKLDNEDGFAFDEELEEKKEVKTKSRAETT